MAQFRFKYQSVLKHRRTIEDLCQRELARHLRQRMILQHELTNMQNTIMDSKRNMTEALVGKVDLSQVGQFARFSGQTAQRAHGMVVKLAQGERQIGLAREKLNEATRQRKAIELLHDRHHRRWREDQDRRETASLDDLALQAFVRKAAAGAMR